MKYVFGFFIAILVIHSQTLIGQNYSYKEIPEWVKLVEIPEEPGVSKYEIMSGYYLTLANYQVNLEEEAVFNQEVINVMSYSGITNASQISVSYDTNYQHLVINHLYIWRKGKKIDRTEELSLEIMSNEQSLNQGIYTGQVTAYDILNDIRKDDKIDFAYTLVGDNPIFEKERYLFVPLESTNHIDLYKLRVIYPKEKNYVYTCPGCDSINISDTIIDENRIIEVTRNNVKAVEYEENIPSWTIYYKYFMLSSFHSWTEVNQWAQRVFTLDKPQQLNEVFEEVFIGNETEEEKINKLINYVQDEIRYMGIESGIGSIKPFMPEQVVTQRFGDCKDKSLLLVTLLKEIGVKKAYPALVNVRMKHEIDKLFPSGEVFNHCIVNFEYNDTSYWVDPSISLQGDDFRKLYVHDYGKALVVGRPLDSLQLMSADQSNTGSYVVEEITMKSFTDPAEVVITSKKYGNDADQRRAMLEYNTAQNLEESVINDLKLLFPIVNSTKDISFEDDPENNCFTTTYFFDVDGFWIDGDNGNKPGAHPGYWSFKFEPTTLYNIFRRSNCKERKYDYALAYPLIYNYKVNFNFPKEMLVHDSYNKFDNDALIFEETVEQVSEKTLVIEYNLKIKTNKVTANSYIDVCEEINELINTLPLVIYFTK